MSAKFLSKRSITVDINIILCSCADFQHMLRFTIDPVWSNSSRCIISTSFYFQRFCLRTVHIIVENTSFVDLSWFIGRLKLTGGSAPSRTCAPHVGFTNLSKERLKASTFFSSTCTWWEQQCDRKQYGWLLKYAVLGSSGEFSCEIETRDRLMVILLEVNKHCHLVFTADIFALSSLDKISEVASPI